MYYLDGEYFTLGLKEAFSNSCCPSTRPVFVNLYDFTSFCVDCYLYMDVYMYMYMYYVQVVFCCITCLHNVHVHTYMYIHGVVSVGIIIYNFHHLTLPATLVIAT